MAVEITSHRGDAHRFLINSIGNPNSMVDIKASATVSICYVRGKPSTADIRIYDGDLAVTNAQSLRSYFETAPVVVKP